MTSFAIATSIVLAVILIGDAVLSIRPPKFIARCLTGVNLPREWWWVLIVIKTLAAAGLIIGVIRHDPSITTVVSVGVLAYFICAIVAHIRANFLKSEFWLNCLGMTIISLITVFANLTALLTN